MDRLEEVRLRLKSSWFDFCFYGQIYGCLIKHVFRITDTVLIEFPLSSQTGDYSLRSRLPSLPRRV